MVSREQESPPAPIPIYHVEMVPFSGLKIGILHSLRFDIPASSACVECRSIQSGSAPGLPYTNITQLKKLLYILDQDFSVPGPLIFSTFLCSPKSLFHQSIFIEPAGQCLP